MESPSLNDHLEYIAVKKKILTNILLGSSAEFISTTLYNDNLYELDENQILLETLKTVSGLLKEDPVEFTNPMKQ